MDLNYSAITSSPAYAKSRKMLDTTGKQKSKIIWLFTVGIPAVFFLCFLVTALIPVFALVATFAVGFILFKAITSGSKNWKVMQQALSDFAAANSFTYEPVPYVQMAGKDYSNIQPPLPFKSKLQFNTGHMKGSFHDLPFDYICGSLELIDYRGLSAQSGNSELRPIGALTITLPISLPKLFIDTKRNNVPGFEAKANNIADLQEYNLEGDFPEHYRVFAQKDDQINVLSILTPEVMQKLLEHTYYDVWIEGNKLVVFAQSSPFEYFAGVPEIFAAAEMLLREVDKIARSVRQPAEAQPALASV